MPIHLKADQRSGVPVDDEHLPPLDMPVEAANPWFMHVGIVATVLGAFTLMAGALTFQMARGRSEPPYEDHAHIGTSLAVAGGGTMAVGIPLWIAGAVGTDQGPAEGAVLVVGPGVAGIAASF